MHISNLLKTKTKRDQHPTEVSLLCSESVFTLYTYLHCKQEFTSMFLPCWHNKKQLRVLVHVRSVTLQCRFIFPSQTLQTAFISCWFENRMLTCMFCVNCAATPAYCMNKYESKTVALDSFVFFYGKNGEIAFV